MTNRGWGLTSQLGSAVPVSTLGYSAEMTGARYAQQIAELSTTIRGLGTTITALRREVDEMRDETMDALTIIREEIQNLHDFADTYLAACGHWRETCRGAQKINS